MFPLAYGEHARERNHRNRQPLRAIEPGAIALETDNATPRTGASSSMRGTGHVTLHLETTVQV